MNMEEQMICDCIKEVLAGCEDTVFRPEMRLCQDLGADSLEVLQIVNRIGEQFQISIAMEQFDSSPTVGDLYKTVKFD